MAVEANGTEGYAAAADLLTRRWRDTSFVDSCRPVLHLIPNDPCRILDGGAGAGNDAAALAALGHTVVAVEPIDALRLAGQVSHPTPRIDWLDDSLSDLSVVRAKRERFDVVLLAAVWMHLDERQRGEAMPRLVSLLGDGAVLIMSLRHGPIPTTRRMFDVSAAETMQLARMHGLELVLNVRTESVQALNRSAGITWTWLAFEKAR